MYYTTLFVSLALITSGSDSRSSSHKTGYNIQHAPGHSKCIIIRGAHGPRSKVRTTLEFSRNSSLNKSKYFPLRQTEESSKKEHYLTRRTVGNVFMSHDIIMHILHLIFWADLDFCLSLDRGRGLFNMIYWVLTLVWTRRHYVPTTKQPQPTCWHQSRAPTIHTLTKIKNNSTWITSCVKKLGKWYFSDQSISK